MKRSTAIVLLLMGTTAACKEENNNPLADNSWTNDPNCTTVEVENKADCPSPSHRGGFGHFPYVHVGG